MARSGKAALLQAFTGIPFVEVVAVTDAVDERAQTMAARYHVPLVVKTSDELCALENADAVSIATPENMHLAPVLAAFKHGKHVLVGKAHRDYVDQRSRGNGIHAAREAERILMPGHILRFETKYAAMVKERISGQATGPRSFHLRPALSLEETR